MKWKVNMIKKGVLFHFLYDLKRSILAWKYFCEKYYPRSISELEFWWRILISNGKWLKVAKNPIMIFWDIRYDKTERICFLTFSQDNCFLSAQDLLSLKTDVIVGFFLTKWGFMKYLISIKERAPLIFLWMINVGAAKSVA